MKNKIHKTAIAIALMVFGVAANSCDIDPNAWSMYSYSYVLSYYSFGDIHINYTSTGHAEDSLWGIYIGPKKFTNEWSANAQKEEDVAAFRAICERYGDTSYNRTVKGDKNYTIRMYNENELINIDVVSDADFDGEHPAGTSLADIMQFTTVSPMPYISSGYTDEFDWANYSGFSEWHNAMCNFATTNYYIYENALHPTDMTLSDVTAEELKLMGFGNGFMLAMLFFKKNPTIDQTHTITVTLTGIDNVEYTASHEITF